MGKFYAPIFKSFLPGSKIKFLFATFLAMLCFASTAQIDLPGLSFSPKIFSFSLTNLVRTTYDINETTFKGKDSIAGVDISKLSLKAGIYFFKVTSDNKRTDLIKLIVL